jgi:hypothetical protein
MNNNNNNNNYSKNVTIINRNEFDARLNSFDFFTKNILAVVQQMSECGEITTADLATVRLADSTAAWVCGRVETDYNWISYRMKSVSFEGSSKILRENGYRDARFEQSKHLTGVKHDRYVYWKYTIPMVQLIIVIEPDLKLIDSNPCDPFAYLIDVNDASVETRDCDCVRKNYQSDRPRRNVLQSNYYRDERFELDQGIVRIECWCSIERDSSRTTNTNSFVTIDVMKQ